VTRLAAAFERARAGSRAAFVPYLTAGDPIASGTLALARELDRAGADILELGVPFSDPIADGPVLQRSAERALAAGTTLAKVWRLAKRIRAETSLALVLFTYANPIVHRGLERCAEEAAAAGFDGVLATDVPAEEGRALHDVFRAAGLDTVFLVSPTSPAERMRRVSRLSSGFLYVVSRRGTTGAREDLPADLAATVARARSAASPGRGATRAGGPLPIAVGFGIGTPSAAAAASRLADGVVVGSALVAVAEETGSVARVGRLARSLVRACRRPPHASAVLRRPG
jgi:tryptophan synthase alpha chain